MERPDLKTARRSPLGALAGQAAAEGFRELLLAAEDGVRQPQLAAVGVVRNASGLPVVAGGGAPGLTLTRLLLQAGAARVAVRIDSVAALDRLRLIAEVFGTRRVDALLVLAGGAPRDPGLAATFGLAPRWEAATPPVVAGAAGATGIGADPEALARAARQAGAGRILLQAAPSERHRFAGAGSSPVALPASLLATVGLAAGLPVALVETVAGDTRLHAVRPAGPYPSRSSAA